MSATVAVRGLSVELAGRPILDSVDLEVGAGEWVNIVGPNGAGKTTLLRAVAGLGDRRNRFGTVSVGGAVPNSAASSALLMAFVPQSPVIPPGVLVSDYVLLGRTPHRGLFTGDSPHDLEVVAATLDRLDLAGMGGRDLASLSGGERQRAVLARALSQQAPVLLLDEPTSALDLGHQQEVLGLIDELRRSNRVTVLASFHDLTLAARYGDRVAMLSAGRIVAQGQAAAVLTARNIATVFGARVRVIADEAGPVVVPM